jgi:putative FmdB family regulatory protein
VPLYDFRCDEGCGYFEDMFIPLARLDDAVCPDCQGSITTRIGSVMTVGPMPSKPLRIGQVGRSFESSSELREYKKKNPNSAIIDADSSEWRAHVDRAREKAEATAVRRGYRDLAQQKEKRRQDRQRKRGKVDRKVFV